MCGKVMRLALFLTLTLLGPGWLTAQEPVPVPEDIQGEAWNRLIYVPYKNLVEVFEQQSASVVLPYAEYLKLWKHSLERRGDGQPPLNAVITKSSYVARVEGDLARINGDFTVQVLEKPWAEVEVDFGDAAVGKITSDGDRVLLRGIGDGKYALLFPETGTHELQLELVARVRTSPDGRSFDFTCPPVGITTFELMVPQPDQTIQIQPRLVSLPVEAGAQETRARASLGATSRISASWNPRVSTKPEMELLASVTNRVHVSIDERQVLKDAQLQFDVLRGKLETLRIAVAKGDRILDVSAPNAKVRGWQSDEEDDRQIVTVELLSPVSGSVTIEVHTERDYQQGEPLRAAGMDDEAVVHGVHALDVVRESGQLIISHAADLVLTIEEQLGLTRINAGDVPESLRRADAVYFKYYNPRFRLAVLTRPIEPRLTVNHLSQLIFEEDRLRLMASLEYTIERAGVFDFAMQIPDDLTIDQVSVPGMSGFDVDPQSGMLRVRLQEKQQGALTVRVTGHRDLDPETRDEQQVLPILEPLEVAREEGVLQLYAPEATEVITDEASLAGVQPQPVNSTNRLGAARLVALWTYNRRPVNVEVRTVRKPTRLTARVGTVVRVEQELVRVHTRLEYLVEHAGLDTFRFAVPEALADRLQIEAADANAGAGIKQRSREDEAVDGWVTWTIITQRDVLGQQAFQITYDLPTTVDEADETTKALATLQPLQALGLDDADGPQVSLSRIAGEVAVLKDKSLSVTATTSGEDIESIDVRELTFAPLAPVEDRGMVLSLAYRYFVQPVELQLQAAKHEIQEVVETVVPRAAIEIVMGRERAATFRVRYKVVSSERQRLRLDLPTSAEVLELKLDQNRVALEHNDAEAESGWEAFSINVARSKPADEPFFITLLFRANIAAQTEAAPFTGRGGSQQLRLPRLGDSQNSDVPLQQLKLVLWVPDDYVLVNVPENFTQDAPDFLVRLLTADRRRAPAEGSLNDWIGDDTGTTADFPIEGHAYVYHNLGGVELVEIEWWQSYFLVWVISGSVFIIGWILRPTSWENRLTIVLLLAFGAVLYALRDAEIVVHGLLAARYGLAATLVVWLIHGLHNLTHPRVPAAPPNAAMVPAVVPPPGIFEDAQSLTARRPES